MLRQSVVAGCLFLAVTCDCSAQVSEADQFDLESEARLLLNEVDGPKRATRHRAEQRLIALGSEVLPLLQREEARNTAVSISIERVVRAIREKISRDRLEGTRISLEQSKSLAQALSAVEHLSGYRVIWNGRSDPHSISCPTEFSDVEFWKALDGIADRTQTDWRWAPNRAIAFSDDVLPSSEVTHVVGCFRISAMAVRRRSSFRQSSRRITRVNFQIDVEPNVVPYFATVSDVDFGCAAPEGDLFPFDPDAQREIPFSTRQRASFAVDLSPSGQNTLSSGTLWGAFTIVCAISREEVTLGLDAPRKTAENGTRLTLDSLEPAGDLVVAHVKLDGRLPFSEFDSYRLGMLHHDGRLDAAGERFHSLDVQLEHVTHDQHVVRYIFPSVPGELKQARLVYVHPTMMIRHRVPFQLKDFSLEL